MSSSGERRGGSRRKDGLTTLLCVESGLTATRRLIRPDASQRCATFGPGPTGIARNDLREWATFFDLRFKEPPMHTVSAYVFALIPLLILGTWAFLVTRKPREPEVGGCE